MESINGKWMKLAANAVHWLVTILILLFLVTGFGMTESRTVEPLTFGLLTKALATQIHFALSVPFVIILGLHAYFGLFKPKK